MSGSVLVFLRDVRAMLVVRIARTLWEREWEDRCLGLGMTPHEVMELGLKAAMLGFNEYSLEDRIRKPPCGP